MEAERSSRSIEQWYKKITNLDRHWRESKKEKKRLRERRETGNSAPRINIPANTGGAQRQQLP